MLNSDAAAAAPGEEASAPASAAPTYKCISKAEIMSEVRVEEGGEGGYGECCCFL